MQHLLADLTPLSAILLVGALLLAFSFEAINGFHDTANAVATVIYTHTLKPYRPVPLRSELLRCCRLNL